MSELLAGVQVFNSTGTMADHGDEIALDDSEEEETEQVQTKEKSKAEILREQRIKKLQDLQLRKV